jgi:hypothetical protein
MQKLDIHRHSRPSSAYAEAASAAIEAADEIKVAALKTENGLCRDCREATWIDAEHMTRLALKLQEIVRQFGQVTA